MTSGPPRVLVVEDEREIRRFVRAALQTGGLVVDESATAAQGLADAAKHRPDLVILDLGLPDRDGLEFIADLRGWSDVPIIVLSARRDETDKIRALDRGADDYLTKPFGVGELLARVRAALRRRPAAGDAQAAEPALAFGDVEIDCIGRTVRRGGQPVHLTPIEYRLLTVLVRHPGKVMTHRQLLREIWGPSHVDRAHYLRIYMSQLRRKLEDDPHRPRFLRTETGIGYRFGP